jgi:microtubule-associated protein-like 1/2
LASKKNEEAWTEPSTAVAEERANNKKKKRKKDGSKARGSRGSVVAAGGTAVAVARVGAAVAVASLSDGDKPKDKEDDDEKKEESEKEDEEDQEKAKTDDEDNVGDKEEAEADSGGDDKDEGVASEVDDADSKQESEKSDAEAEGEDDKVEIKESGGSARSSKTQSARSSNPQSPSSSKAQSARSMREAKSRSGSVWVTKEVERVDEETVMVNTRGQNVMIRIPPDYRDDWDVTEKEDKPDLELGIEWVYGYRGRDSSDNMHNLPTGEVVYYIASIAVLYNPEAQTQRHFAKHSNDIECIAVHPTKPLVATGQKPGINGNAYVMCWDYDTLDLIHTIGNEDESFSNSISCVSFSWPDEDGDSVLAVVDADERPVLSIWSMVEKSPPKQLHNAIASNDDILSVHFLPESTNELVATGKGQVSLWTFSKQDNEAGLDKKQGLFTRKIPRPHSVNCSTFAATGEILTGDSDGNVMIWGGVKVIRVLKGAHEGSVADICIMDDGSIVSGGLSDGAFVVFNDQYQLIGAGATLPENLGCVRRIQKRSFSVSEEDGSIFYHLLVGTTSNSIVDVSFTVRPGKTEIESAEFEVLVQGHSGEVRDVQAIPKEDKFISGGDDQNIIMWDAVAHKAIWNGNVNSAINCVSVAPDRSNFVFGLESGAVYHVPLEPSTGEMSELWSHEESITAVAYSPDSEWLAVGTQDNKIVLTSVGSDDADVVLTGHSAHVTHLDWSSDGIYLRSNSSDYEIYYWDTGEKSQLTDGEAIDDTGPWESQRCTLCFDTIGIWPIRDANGTDVNACDATDDVLAVGDDNGEVLLYKYPAVQPDAEFDILSGHSSHVTGVAFLQENSLVSAGGRESSIIQWGEKSGGGGGGGGGGSNSAKSGTPTEAEEDDKKNEENSEGGEGSRNEDKVN